MNLDTAISVAADWWTIKVFSNLNGESIQVRRHKKKRINKKWAKRYGFKNKVDKEALRTAFEKNIREYVGSNLDDSICARLTIGAYGYREDLDNIVLETIMEVGLTKRDLHRRANLGLCRWYGQPERYSIWAYENDMDDPDYRCTLLDVE